MSYKRKHTEGSTEPKDTHTFKKQKQNFRPSGSGKPSGKRPFSHRGSARPKKEEDDGETTSVSALKSRIRSIKRLLDRVDNDPKNKMPQGLRIERERELETCEHELAEKQAAQRESSFRNKIISKYHHIRFFERQKATRNVKRLQKQLSSASDDAEKRELLDRIHNAQVDVSYAMYYPLLKPYVSLFPKTNKDEEAEGESADKSSKDDIARPRGDPDMWKTVEKAMEEGTLETLRESRDGVTIPAPKPPVSKTKAAKKAKDDDSKKQRSNDTHEALEEDEEESDGGFFE